MRLYFPLSGSVSLSRVWTAPRRKTGTGSGILTPQRGRLRGRITGGMLDSEVAREALSYVEELARVEPAVGLLCFERSERNCHRDVILQRIKQ